MTEGEILNFWFEHLSPNQWWIKDLELDKEITTKFEKIHAMAIAGELFHWRSTPEGRLAEIIILDQFSRNIYRNKPESFSQDSQALCLAQEAIATGDDLKLDTNQRIFLYLPFMHSESLVIHEIAIKLFNQSGMESNLDFEVKHKEIIERFGRYPHRNEVLGRKSSQEEIEFLKQPGSSF